jgi:hypothetical protein
MASAKQSFAKQAEAVACEHHELMDRLSQLDSALDSLVCYAEVYADLGGSARVVESGKWLHGWLPQHFVREEETVLAAAARLGPEFAAFAREMKQQHRDFGARLQKFCKVMDDLSTTPDLEHCICELKEQGKALTASMAAHMGAEERKFASIK